MKNDGVKLHAACLPLRGEPTLFHKVDEFIGDELEWRAICLQIREPEGGKLPRSVTLLSHPHEMHHDG